MTGPEDPEPSLERDVEGEEERFYTRADPSSPAALPPDPGTTPAELEETDAAGLADRDRGSDPAAERRRPSRP